MGRYILVERALLPEPATGRWLQEAFCGFAAQSVVDGVVAAVPSRKSYLHAREDTPLHLCGGITSVLSHYLGTGQSPCLHATKNFSWRDHLCVVRRITIVTRLSRPGTANLPHAPLNVCAPDSERRNPTSRRNFHLGAVAYPKMALPDRCVFAVRPMTRRV